jgi:hypothetical protein
MAQYHTQNAAGYTQNYTGNPYAPPVYSPFQNAAHVDDAFGYMANMYGPGLVQGVFGPDAFLAHQSPGQARMDQFTAARYQRHGVAAIEAANMAGNEQVAQKLLGFQRVVNGGQPVTDLDREHANIGARVLNNPIFKQFAASQIGAENLEGIMFGRRGDPTAIAASTNRIGFFRADAAGHGPRMSSDSLRQFSQNVYQNLYGPDANLDEMHGFGAVASGEMMETLFQQGRLPKSLGALSAADRVRAIGKTKRDDKTMNELARQFGHSELLSRDAAYASASEEEQKLMLADKMPSFRKRLDSTFSEIDKFSAKDSRAKSAEEIEQMNGFGLAANALDAKNVSRAVKEYNGAVSAIREIFGDNGNPNAPIQQLIANLQHLTNGAQGSMGAGKVESLVREIRLAARDTNTDLQNLNSIAAEKKAMARGLGLQEVTAEKGLAGDLLRGQAMADAGVFEKPGFGKLNRAEAEARVSAMSTRGDASSVGRAMAAMNRLVSENPDKYKDTQLSAAMEAYRRGEDKYQYKGKTFNLAEMAGQQGVQGLYNMAREGGADDRLFRAYMTDQIGTEEYMKAGYAYKTQRFELQRDLSRAHAGALIDKMGGDAFQRLKPAGMSEEAFREKSGTLATSFANKMTGIMIDETADMTPEERVKTLERRGKEELVRYFKSSAGGGLKGAAADRMAEQYFNMFYGQNESDRRDSLLATYSETSAISQQRTGLSIEAHKQGYNQTALTDSSVKEEMNKRRADRFKMAARGTESGFVQRVGDELERLAGDNAGTRTESLKRIFNIASEDSLLQSYAPDMQEGLVAAARMYTQASVTEKQIDILADAAQKNPDGTEAKQLKIMAGVDPGKKMTADELGELRGAAKMKSADTAAGSTDADKAQNQQQRDRADLIMRGFNTGKAEDVQAAAKAMARQTLGAKATTEQIEKFASAALAADSADFEKQMSAAWDGWGGLSDDKKEAARGVAQALRVARDIGGLAGAGLEQTPVDVAKAQKRGTATSNRVVGDAGQNIYDTLEKNYDKAAYEKLRPKGMTDSQFDTQRKKRLRQISLAMSDVAVNQMSDTAGKSDEERAFTMTGRVTQHLTDQLVMEGMDPEAAQAEARKQLTAVLGSDKEAIIRRTSSALKVAEAAKRAHGQGVATPTEKVTAEQQKVLDTVAKDPTGAALKTAMQDPDKRKQLLTLPTADAVKLFNQLDPAAQQEAVGNFKKALDNPFAAQTFYSLSDDDMANIQRIHGAISESKTGAGISSQNITPAQAQQLNRAGHAAASGAPTPAAAASNMPAGATRQQSRAEALGEIDRELAQIEERNKNNWFDYNKEDKERRTELMGRRFAMTHRDRGRAETETFKVHDPYNMMGQMPGQSFSLREVQYGLNRQAHRGLDSAERVFLPYNPDYTEEQAKYDVERYGTQAEKDAFRKRGGAKKVNVTAADGSVQQVVEKPHARLVAEQAFLDMQSGDDPIQSARQRLAELEKKKKTVSGGIKFDDERDHARYNFLTDTLKQYEAARASSGGRGAQGGGSGGDMNIQGVLTLRGLSEAVLQAGGRRMEDTPDNGPAVDMAGGTGANYGK